MPPARLTHFLCIPLLTPSSRPQLHSSLTKFRDTVTSLRTPELPNGIPEAAVRPLGTLHLTLGVMSLLTPERVERALEVLRGLDLRRLLAESAQKVKLGGNAGSKEKEKEKEDVEMESGKNNELRVTLRGLVSMHTPSSTSILYASPLDPDLRLYNFCHSLRSAFVAADLLVSETRPLLLHATIVNTVYVPGVRGKGSGHGKGKAKLMFDVRELLEEWEGCEWMSDVRAERVAVCRMGAKRDGEGEEEYVIEGSVDMP